MVWLENYGSLREEKLNRDELSHQDKHCKSCLPGEANPLRVPFEMTRRKEQPPLLLFWIVAKYSLPSFPVLQSFIHPQLRLLNIHKSVQSSYSPTPARTLLEHLFLRDKLSTTVFRRVSKIQNESKTCKCSSRLN
jgi:hypothetical protein